MEKDLVSVIIPVYRTEAYLDRCVESIVNQTYRNLEILLVDDGSPDNCPQMCDAWAEKDGRIKVIHQENGGLSAARNAAVDICKGKYIVFMDSDDYAEREYVAYLHQLITENQADIAECEFRFQTPKGSVINYIEDNQEVVVLNQCDALWQLCDGTMVSNSACAKIYPAELFQSIRYPEGHVFEDLGTTYKLFLRSEKIAFGKRALYNYIRHEKTIMTSGFKWERLSAVTFSEEMYAAVVERWPGLEKIAKKKLFCEYAEALRSMMLSGEKTARIKKSCDELYVKLCAVRSQAGENKLPFRVRCYLLFSYFGKTMMKIGFLVGERLFRLIKLHKK